MGGNSILSIKLIKELRDRDINLGIKNIFDLKTPLKISALVELQRNEKNFSIDPEQRLLTGSFELSPVQKVALKDVKSQPEFFKLEFYNAAYVTISDSLSIGDLNNALIKLVRHHDMLRASINLLSGEQSYQAEINVPEITTRLQTVSLTQTISELLTELSKNNAETQGTLPWSVNLITDMSAKVKVLCIIGHALIVDGYSLKILLEDLCSLYHKQKLPQKDISYRQYSEYLNSNEHKLTTNNLYWINTLNSIKKCERDKTVYSKTLSTNKLTLDIPESCNGAYNTTSDELLISALLYPLKELNNSICQSILIADLNRARLDDVACKHRTVGKYSCLYPLELKLYDNIFHTIVFTKESKRAIERQGSSFSSFISSQPNILDSLDIPISFTYLDIDSQVSTDWGKCSLYQEGSQDIGVASNCKVNITCKYDNGSVIVEIHSILPQEVISSFIKSFNKAFNEIIDHTKERLKISQYKTLSDHKGYMPYEIINKESQSIPLVFFPPLNGGPESYYNNPIPHLENYKLIMLGNFHLEYRDDYKYSSAEEVAMYYYFCLKKVINLSQRCKFIGWSFGGVISFEVARQFDLSVDLVLIDMYFVDRENTEHFRMLNGRVYEHVLSNEKVNITLLKATQPDADREDWFEKVNDLCVASKDNFLSDSVTENIKTQVIEIEASHLTIINHITGKHITGEK